MKKRIALIGLGLIGGSLAKALSYSPDYEIHGHDADMRTKVAALAEGAIQSDLIRGMRYDAVILSVKPSVVVELAKNLPFGISADLLIDASGVKSKLSHELEELVEQGLFGDYLGIHTMAGREVSGYENSRADLFKRASCILTPTPRTRESSIEFASALARAAGCEQIVIAEPEAHDRIIAYTSQLAHIASNAFVKSPAAFKHAGYTGGSYQDLTRVAQLDAKMWTELFFANSEHLLPEIDSFLSELKKVRDALSKGERGLVERLLESGSRKKISADSLAKMKAELRAMRSTSELSVIPGQLSGFVKVPSSKSEAHRRLIAAALMPPLESIVIEKLDLADDIYATLICLAELGAKIELVKIENKRVDIRITGIDRETLSESVVHLEVEESAATLRLILPVAVALAQTVTLTRGDSLARRPLEPLLEAFRNHGIRVEELDSGKLMFSGNLSAGHYRIRGDISSQFISGLFFALPLLNEKSDISLSTELESKGYLNMTMQALREFGVLIFNEGQQYKIAGGQRFSAPGQTIEIEADYSSAAVWKIAQALGSSIELGALSTHSIQPDRVLDELIARFKQEQTRSEQGVARKSFAPTEPIDISEAPDLLPVLAVLAARSSGTTYFVNAARLRLKESDRLESVARLLRSAGASVELGEDSMAVTGVETFKAAVLETENDHRLVMAAALIALSADGPCLITEADSVAKSYPRFFLDLKSLGGRVLSKEEFQSGHTGEKNEPQSERLLGKNEQLESGEHHV